MSELSREQREKFIKEAKENKVKFDKLLTLKKEVFGEMKPEHLKTIFDNGTIDDLFTLKLIEYAELYHEFELKQLNLHVVSVNEVELCGICKEPFEIITGKICEHKDCVRYK